MEKLKRSEEMSRIEEHKKEKAYTNLKVISSSLKTHKNELDKA